MKIELDLTKNEYRALWACLSEAHWCCYATCAFQELANKKVDCEKCPFTKAIITLKNKINRAEEKQEYSIPEAINDFKLIENKLDKNELYDFLNYLYERIPEKLGELL